MIKLLTLGLVTLFIILTIGVVFLFYFNPASNPFSSNDEETSNKQLQSIFLERRDLRTYENLNGLLGYESNINVTSYYDGIVTEIPSEGENLERGNLIFKLYKSVTDLQILNADQQISAAMASVAQAELSLTNLETPPTEAEILSADASIIQAEITLENLTSTPSDSQIVSADAAVLQSEIALQNLLEGPSESQIAAADAAVAHAELALENLQTPASEAQIAAADTALIQAEASLINAQSALESAWASRRIAHEQFCEQAYGKILSGSNYWETLCPVHELAISTTITETILRLIENKILVSESQSLLQAYHGYVSAANSTVYTESAVLQAIANRSALDRNPTLSELNQAQASLDSAHKQRNYLETKPSELAISHALATLESAKSQRASLNDPPDSKAIASAVKSLESARTQRNSLYDPPDSKSVKSAEKNLEATKLQRASLDEDPGSKEVEQAKMTLKSSIEQRKSLDTAPTQASINQAMASLESAQASLHSAWVSREQYVEGYYGSILMYGPFPAWRDFRLGITPGEDVKHLEVNLVALGFDANGQLKIDQIFDEKTEKAVRQMQETYGLTISGTLNLGDIVLTPGKSMVEYTNLETDVGNHITSGETIMLLTPMEKTDSFIGKAGLTTSSISLQRVETQILVSDQDLIEIGSQVQIELPDETIVTGMIMEIGKVAIVPTGNQAEDPFFEVSIAVTDSKDIIKWTGAPVTVSVTKTFAQDVLSVPVSGLLALLGGGYAIEVMKEDATILVPVETGIYSDGWVEIDGPGLTEGLEIVIPE